MNVLILMAMLTGISSNPSTYDAVHIEKSDFRPVMINKFAVRVQPVSRSYDDTIKFIDPDRNALQEGSFCRRTHDGGIGYCRLAYHCRHVYEEHKLYNIKIDICLYKRAMPIVCCPLKGLKAISHLRISAQKCREYSKIASRMALIVGGENAEAGEFPHMAAIGWTRSDRSIKWSCAGSLISENFVLTVAHCQEMAGNTPDIVRLGDQNLYTSDDEADPHDFGIIEITAHPRYKPTSIYYDIALIRLNRSVIFTKFVKPACLWQSPELNLTKVVATGWGRIAFHGRKSEHLQKVTLKLIDRQTCNKSYGNEKSVEFGIMSNQICAGYLEGGKDTCQGDSGGPLQAAIGEDKRTHHIIGITSFGKYCAVPNYPGVYTKISSFLDWIEEIVFAEDVT